MLVNIILSMIAIYLGIGLLFGSFFFYFLIKTLIASKYRKTK